MGGCGGREQDRSHGRPAWMLFLSKVSQPSRKIVLTGGNTGTTSSKSQACERLEEGRPS